MMSTQVASGRDSATDIYSSGKVMFIAMIMVVTAEIGLLARYWTKEFVVICFLSYALVSLAFEDRHHNLWPTRVQNMQKRTLKTHRAAGALLDQRACHFLLPVLRADASAHTDDHDHRACCSLRAAAAAVLLGPNCPPPVGFLSRRCCRNASFECKLTRRAPALQSPTQPYNISDQGWNREFLAACTPPSCG